MAMLLAKLQGKPVSATRVEQDDSLGANLDLLSLAGAVVRPDASGEDLAAIYGRLLAVVKEAAA
jgi:hypothetical protein